MILSVERFKNSDNRSIEDLFYGVQREIVNEPIDCAIVLMIDTLLDSVKAKRRLCPPDHRRDFLKPSERKKEGDSHVRDASGTDPDRHSRGCPCRPVLSGIQGQKIAATTRNSDGWTLSSAKLNIFAG